MSTAKGRRAEQQAARYLQLKGYRVLARNVRLGRGEIDIIATRGDILAFVEVKAHSQRESSLQAVHADKCRRLHSAASAWLAQHGEFAALQCRFDLIILTPEGGWRSWLNIEHLQDAFRPS